MLDYVAKKEPEGVFVQQAVIAVEVAFGGNQQVFGGFFFVNDESAAIEE